MYIESVYVYDICVFAQVGLTLHVFSICRVWHWGSCNSSPTSPKGQHLLERPSGSTLTSIKLKNTPKFSLSTSFSLVEGEDFPTWRHKFHLSSVMHHNLIQFMDWNLRKSGVLKRSPRCPAKSSVFSWSWRMHQEKWLHLCCFKAAAMHPGICIVGEENTHLKDATKNPAVDSACFQCIYCLSRAGRPSSKGSWSCTKVMKGCWINIMGI